MYSFICDFIIPIAIPMLKHSTSPNFKIFSQISKLFSFSGKNFISIFFVSGIQEFAGSEDIEISQGNDLDSVVATWAVKPVDAMEKLYLTCNIRG